ncbi:MAG: hypothetical protein HY825_18515 [Acidobacteria bacterium]|nr:hypothetical protein [Acidobacteriota bacterium]
MRSPFLALISFSASIAVASGVPTAPTTSLALATRTGEQFIHGAIADDGTVAAAVGPDEGFSSRLIIEQPSGKPSAFDVSDMRVNSIRLLGTGSLAVSVFVGGAKEDGYAWRILSTDPTAREAARVVWDSASVVPASAEGTDVDVSEDGGRWAACWAAGQRLNFAAGTTGGPISKVSGEIELDVVDTGTYGQLNLDTPEVEVAGDDSGVAAVIRWAEGIHVVLKPAAAEGARAAESEYRTFHPRHWPLGEIVHQENGTLWVSGSAGWEAFELKGELTKAPEDAGAVPAAMIANEELGDGLLMPLRGGAVLHLEASGDSASTSGSTVVHLQSRQGADLVVTTEKAVPGAVEAVSPGGKYILVAPTATAPSALGLSRID